MKTAEIEKTTSASGVNASQGYNTASRTPMTLERYLRIISGAFVLLSLALGHWVSPYWFLFTAFVGCNLFQSGFTNWCPMMTMLRKAGVRN